MSLFPTFGKVERSKAPSDDFWYYMPGIESSSGVAVDEKTAIKYLTVFSCVSLIAGDVARLPLNLYRKRPDGGKDLVTDHKLYDLLHNAPNEETTSFNWREAAQGHLLLWGNHYSFIERDKAGNITGLWQIPDPGGVKVRRVGGRLIYEYLKEGKLVRRTRDEVFHIPGYGWNGLYGLSMIAMAREAIGMGLAAEQFGSKYFSNGTHPSGVMEMEESLGDNREEYLKHLKDGYAGLGKSHRIMVLENGLKYKPLTIPMDDAQFLETRDHQKIEICGMYHVPPHKIAIHGQNSNYNNLEQENASYVDSCLMHWIVRWESAISQQLLTENERRSGLFFEFLVAGLLRGDSQARAEFYNKIFQVGGITPNEIRSKENMNPIDGGDQSFVQLNLVPLDKAGELVEKQLEDDPEPAPEPENEPDTEELKSFFSEDKEKRDLRSVQLRDRIVKQYYPLVRDAAEQVVNRECNAVKRRVEKKSADNTAVKKFLDDFYGDFPEYINKKMGPVLRSLMLAISDASANEIGSKPGEIETEIREYIDRYVERHVSSSLGQMTALLEGELGDLSQRADEWNETRPDKIASNETVRASSAAFQWVAFGAGLATVWRTRGPDTCPYCTSLRGKRVAAGETFVKDGDTINTTDGPMRIRGMKAHPPLHQGCDCYLGIG